MASIVYRFESGLYINLTNRCTNHCSFCIRIEHDTVGNSESLWLDREPTVDEVWNAILAEEQTYKEIVFCGYGEPLTRLDEVMELCRRIHGTLSVPVRINTNGQADLLHHKKVAPLLAGLADVVSVSLNAPTKERYNEICRPADPNALDALIRFAEDCRDAGIETHFSVVDEPLSRAEIDACLAIGERTSIPVRVRVKT